MDRSYVPRLRTIWVGRPFVRPETPVTSFCGPITAGWWVRTPSPAKRLVRPRPDRGCVRTSCQAVVPLTTSVRQAVRPTDQGVKRHSSRGCPFCLIAWLPCGFSQPHLRGFFVVWLRGCVVAAEGVCFDPKSPIFRGSVSLLHYVVLYSHPLFSLVLPKPSHIASQRNPSQNTPPQPQPQPRNHTDQASQDHPPPKHPLP